jgi:multiple sugar transport system substrate-binding protein
MFNDRISRRRLVTSTAVAAAATTLIKPAGVWAGPSRLQIISKGRRQDSKTVKAWFFGGLPGEDDWRKPRIEQFQTETGITVDAEFRPWENQRQDLLAALTGGDVPDLIRVHHKYVGEFGATGDLQAFEDLPGWSEYAANFVPAYADALINDGKHYGVPIYVFPFIFVANQKLVDQFGLTIPTNWDDFKSTSATVVQNGGGIYSYTAPGGVNLDTAYRFVPWLFKAGGRVLNDDWSQVTFNEPAGVAALEMFVELQKSGAIPAGNAAYASAESNDVWGAQRAVFATEGPWWQGTISEQYNLSLDTMTVAPVPAPATPIGSASSGSLVDIIMMTLMAEGKNVEGGWQLLQYLINPDTDKAFITEEGTGLPVTNAAYGSDVQWGIVGQEVYASEAQTAVIWPNHPNISEIQMKVAEACNAAFSGTSSAKDALDKAAEESQSIIEE